MTSLVDHGGEHLDYHQDSLIEKMITNSEAFVLI